MLMHMAFTAVWNFLKFEILTPSQLWGTVGITEPNFYQNRSKACGDIAIWQFSTCWPSAILISSIFNSYETNFALSYQILSRWVKPLLRYRNFCDFGDDGCRHLDFQKITILKVDPLEWASMRNLPNFSKIGGTVAELWRFHSFQNGSRTPSCILKFIFFYGSDPFCSTVPNFVMIGQTIAKILQFFLWFSRVTAGTVLDF